MTKVYVTIGALAAPLTPFPASSFSDTFPGSTYDSSVWQLEVWGSTCSVSVSGNELHGSIGAWSSPNAGASIATKDTYSLIGNSVQVKLSTAATIGSYSGLIMANNPDLVSSSDAMALGVYSGNLVVSAVSNTVLAPYDAVNHKYLRLRESAGTAYVDTSADGISWNSQAALTGTDYGFIHSVIESGYIILWCGNDSTCTAATSVAFSDFNIGAGLPVTPQGSVAFSALNLTDAYATTEAYSLSADFPVGSSNEDIRDAIEAVVHAQSGLSGASVEFL